MTKLYEKITHGDRRTIVRKHKCGTALSTGTSTIVLKADVALKVTQEYDARRGAWLDLTIHLNDMVETPAAPEVEVPPPPPEPTTRPSWLARVIAIFVGPA